MEQCPLCLLTHPFLRTALGEGLAWEASEEDVVLGDKVLATNLGSCCITFFASLSGRENIANVTAKIGFWKGCGVDLLAVFVPLHCHDTLCIGEDFQCCAMEPADPGKEVDELNGGFEHFHILHDCPT